MAEAVGTRQGSPLRYALPLSLRSRCKGGDTPRLAVATPHLRQEAFGMYMPRFNAEMQRPTPRRKHP